MMADIDREMAEKVMEWHEDSYAPWGGLPHEGPSWVREDGAMILQRDFTPSTDISQALGDSKSLDTVVGMMKKKGYDLILCTYSGQNKNTATFLLPPTAWNVPHDWTGQADTPAMAICLAAEKAVKDV